MSRAGGDVGGLDRVQEDALNASQREALETFMAVSNIGSRADAVRRMHQSGWNLNSAVNAFLSESSSSPRAPRNQNSRANSNPISHQSANTQPTSQNGPPSSVARRNNANAGRGWGAVFRVLMLPLRFAFSMVGFLANRLLALIGLQPPLLTAPDGASAATDFAREFARLYASSSPNGAEDAPEFSLGSIQDALEKAGREYKFVLVYLHSDSDENAARFCRDVLLHRPFSRLVRDSFIFWAASTRYAEAAAARRVLRASRFPFLAVLRSRPGSSRSRSSEIVALKQGSMTSAESSEWLQRILDRFGISLTTARIEQEEREAARSLREQQDAEFQRALEEDRARERRKREEEERAAEEQRRQIEEQNALERAAADAAARREQKRASLPPECTEKERCATVVLRLPDGGRVSRRFDRGEKLSVLFDWADVQGVELVYACLVSNYPRKLFHYPEDSNQTFQEAGLSPSAMLLVEERDDSPADLDHDAGSHAS